MGRRRLPLSRLVETLALWQDAPMEAATFDAAIPGIALRRLQTTAEYLDCVELQQVTWGRGFEGLVPVSVLKISQKVGGVVAGAYDETASGGERGERMVGFVFGLTGVRPRPEGGPPRLVHWSHMLAIAPEERDRGIGRLLKIFQRRLLLPLGVESIEWTYDPLESRNAHFNLNHLGAEVADYVEEMYAGEEGSVFAAGIGSDRFILSWQLAGPRAEAALAGRRPEAGPFREAPLANPEGDAAAELPQAPRVRVEIPADVQKLKDASLERAQAYRASTRRALLHYLGRGYRVEAFFTTGERSFYGLLGPEGGRSDC